MNRPSGSTPITPTATSSSHFIAPRDDAEKQTSSLDPADRPRSAHRRRQPCRGTRRTRKTTCWPSQRMAEQTAALHRQFLEGQEKTQQIFLKLLEQEQRVVARLARFGRHYSCAIARAASQLKRSRTTLDTDASSTIGRLVRFRRPNHRNGNASGRAVAEPHLARAADRADDHFSLPLWSRIGWPPY